MFTRLSLRLRIFLFFCLLAAGGMILAAGALWFGWSRSEVGLPSAPFITALILFGFLNTGLALGVWLLFDENVAKPIQALSADLRLRAHAGVAEAVPEEAARYLGDLAPAANALSETVGSSVMDTAAKVARETQRLRDESDQLTALLTQIPIATIMLNPAYEIVLYDAQAADVLSKIGPPRLKAPMSDYFDPASLADAITCLDPTHPEVAFDLQSASGDQSFSARIKSLGTAGHILFIDPPDEASPQDTARPLVFDFGLMETRQSTKIMDTALGDLCFVPFDTETTGLSVERDDIIQLGAVRVLKGRIVEGEVIDAYVNPGRSIPPGSTKIHKITDADVADAPDITQVGRAFHHFARQAVLVAHNAPFDIGLLRRVQDQIGVTWDHPVVDTVLLSAVVFGTTEDHTLDALCARLSITIPEALRHTALGDARATAEALVKLLPLLEGKGIRTFGHLVDQTGRHSRLLEDLN